MSRTFGVDPVHLGVIFLANLELGYLTPPVGLNLFLAALRFDKPLVKIYKSVIPFLIIMAITVVIITYVPALTDIGMHILGYK
jgi:TRAP-type C4-dicarboxylate transport system permease large subunit